MAEPQTRKTGASVKAFIDGIDDDRMRADSRQLMKIMSEVTGKRPKMWGPSIVGYGSHHYRYESGREGDWFLTGFSPRRQALTLYLMSGFSEHAALLKKLGRHKTGKACLYIKKLDDVHLQTLKKLIRQSVARAKKPAR